MTLRPALISGFLAIALSSMTFAEQSTPADSSRIRYGGRVALGDGAALLGYPGIEIELRFRGSRVSFSGEVLGQDAFFNATIDGAPLPRVDLGSGAFERALAAGLDPQAEHTLRLVRRNESWHGLLRIDSFNTDGKLLAPPARTRERKMLCIGDSITCGEATDLAPPATAKAHEHWNAEASYGWRLAKRFDAQVALVSYGGRGLTRDWQGIETGANAPDLFERTLPDDPSARWDHEAYQPDLVTIALGTNDFSQGIPERGKFVSTYIRFIERIQNVHPQARVLLISSPWFGEGDPKKAALNGYIDEVVRHFSAGGDNDAPSVRAFHFEATYTGTELDMHPTAAEHEAMAAEIAPAIESWLGW